jgi:hypothetical protein
MLRNALGLSTRYEQYRKIGYCTVLRNEGELRSKHLKYRVTLYVNDLTLKVYTLASINLSIFV